MQGGLINGALPWVIFSKRNIYLCTVFFMEKRIIAKLL